MTAAFSPPSLRTERIRRAGKPVDGLHWSHGDATERSGDRESTRSFLRPDGNDRPPGCVIYVAAAQRTPFTVANICPLSSDRCSPTSDLRPLTFRLRSPSF